MPFCPKCREQYEAHVTRCADCDVDLVASLSGVRAAAGESDDDGPAIRAFTIYAANEAIADRLVAALSRIHCPCIRAEAPEEVKGRTAWAVSIPDDFAPNVLALLGVDEASVERTQHGASVFVSPGERNDAAGAEEEIVNPPLLQESMSTIVRRGPAVIPDLLSIVWRGDNDARLRAAQILAEMGVAGAQALTEVGRKAVVEGERDRLHAIMKGLAEVHGYRPDESFGPFVEDRNSTTRALAAMVIGRTGSATSIHLLVPLLEDPEVEVREEAIEGLYHIAHEDLGFEADAPDADRAAAVAKWKARV